MTDVVARLRVAARRYEIQIALAVVTVFYVGMVIALVVSDALRAVRP